MRLKKRRGKTYVLKSAASTGPRRMLAASHRWDSSWLSVVVLLAIEVSGSGRRLRQVRSHLISKLLILGGCALRVGNHTSGLGLSAVDRASAPKRFGSLSDASSGLHCMVVPFIAQSRTRRAKGFAIKLSAVP